MKILIRSPITASKKLGSKIKGRYKNKGKEYEITATLISNAQYESRINRNESLTYQFKDNGYRFYSKPGKQQYTWDYFCVQYK